MTINLAQASIHPTSSSGLTPLTNSATRAVGDRFGDVYNVKDYGAVGDGVADDTTKIQNAANACISNGGILYFPNGTYKITSTITFDATSQKGIRIIGSGGGNAAVLSSRITGNINGYLFDFQYDTGGPTYNDPVRSIEYLCFDNQHTPSVGQITNTEPVGTTTGGVAGTACGCIHMPGGIANRLVGCNFNFLGGIGIFNFCQNAEMAGCSFTGPYGSTNASDSIAVIGNGLHIHDCKINTVGYGVVITGGGNNAVGIISNIDFEEIGTAIALGYSPIGVLSPLAPPSSGTIWPAGVGAIEFAHIKCINIENPGDSDLSSKGVIYASNSISNLIIDGIDCLADGVASRVPPYGLKLDGSANSIIRSAFFNGSGGASGGISTALFSVSNTTSGVKFFGCSGFNTHTGAVGWDLSSLIFLTGANGVQWEYCDTDGALAFASLPASPTSYGQTMICSDVPGVADTTLSSLTSYSGTTITLATAGAHGLSPGDLFNISAATGTGADLSRINGEWLAITGTTGTTLKFTIASGLTITTVTGGTVQTPPIIGKAVTVGSGTWKAKLMWNGAAWIIVGR